MDAPQQRAVRPEESYCRQRTRNRLARLGLAVLFLVVGLSCGVLFIDQMAADKTDWDAEDYVTLVVAGVVGVGGTLLGLYEGYTDVRDAFLPEKSRLARSIRAQLPYPDEAPEVKELFAMVDRDIRENGQWFDRVAVGKEWVLGDEVTAVSRIRVVAGRDEIVHRHTNGRTQTSRIIELHILDDRRQIQISDLRDPNELSALLTCLKLRAPEALFVPYNAFSNYGSKTGEEWESLEREYQTRLSERTQRAQEREYAASHSNPDFVFSDLQGQRTSRFDWETIERQISGLEDGGRPIVLEALHPVPVPGFSTGGLAGLYVSIVDGGLFLAAKLQLSGGVHFFGRTAEEGELRGLFTDLLERRQFPELDGRWRPLQQVTQARPRQKKLMYSDKLTTREFTSFSRRDVELAGDNLARGTYTVVALYAGARYLYLKAGDKTDGRITANASRPDPDELRVFEIKCTDRQARSWLLEMNDGTFAPDFSQWKDITKQLQKKASQK